MRHAPPPDHPTVKPLHRLLLWSLALTGLLGVFALYTRPAFLVNLAEQLWSCF